MGEVLDLELQNFVSVTEGFSAPDSTLLEEIRHNYNLMCQHFQPPHPKNIKILEAAIEGPDCDIPIRVYRPLINNGPYPTLLYFHGGGWVLGNLDSHDSITADLASYANVQVIAVDYRLAPEHPYPAAVDDCWAVYQSIIEAPKVFSVDVNRLIVGGDSAGGTLAAVISMIARDINMFGFNAPQPQGQLLIYPALSSETLPSREQQSQAPLFTTPDLDNFINFYLGHSATDQNRTDFKIFPAQAGNFSNLPTAYISSAELDPLSDDGPDYANKLRGSSVMAKIIVERGLMHGWLRARRSSPRAAKAFARVVLALKDFAAQ